MAHQNHIVVAIGGQYRIQLFDQDTLRAIVHARAAFRELDVAEVFHRRRVVDGDVGRSGSRATLTVGDGGGNGDTLGLRAAAVGFVERNRAGIVLTIRSIAISYTFTCGPGIAESPAAFGTRGSGVQRGSLATLEIRRISGNAAHRGPAVTLYVNGDGANVDRVGGIITGGVGNMQTDPVIARRASRVDEAGIVSTLTAAINCPLITQPVTE